jgi:hypothetical protein
MEQLPSIARVVHYVAYGTPGGEYPVGAHRAAVITEVYPPQGNPGEVDMEPETGIVSLCIMNPTGLFFTQRVSYDPTAQRPGTWHWPERV